MSPLPKPPIPPSLEFQKDISPEDREKIGLKPEFNATLTTKLPELNETLGAALDAFHGLDLTLAAKYFRKLAADLKLDELLITSRGNYSEKNTLNDLTGKEWLQHSKSWLVVDGKPGDISPEIEDHPASYPPSLAEYFIEYFTKQGGWVFDPFLGIGSTPAACATTGRNFFGTELNPKYGQYARQRLSSPPPPDPKLAWHVQIDDARNAPAVWQYLKLPAMDFLITSPPYWNMLKKSRGGVKSALKQRAEAGNDAYYSENPADFGNIDDYNAYLTSLVDLFGSFQPILRPGAYLMVILQNCRPPDGEMRPLAWDFACDMRRRYTLRQEFVWLQNQKFMGIWGWPTTYVSNVHHHYCLVFQNKQ